MKYLVSICWVVTFPMAILKLSYEIAYAYVEYKVSKEIDK